MLNLTVATPERAVEQAILACLHDGSLVNPRGVLCKEVTNASILIEQPWQVPYDLHGRGMRPFIGAVEALQLVGQTTAPEAVALGSQAMSKFTEHGVYHGAYGVRVYGRLGRIVELLKKDESSRQAVLSIYDSKQDLGIETKDVPCTLSIQFMVRPWRAHDAAVCMRVSMRSNDVWLGMPYDLIQFAALQGAIAAGLGLPMGWYAHSVGSLHLYRHDVEKAETVKAGDPDPTRTTAPFLWGDGSIEGVSRTARRILAGRWSPVAPTPFELWLNDSLEVIR